MSTPLLLGRDRSRAERTIQQDQTIAKDDVIPNHEEAQAMRSRRRKRAFDTQVEILRSRIRTCVEYDVNKCVIPSDPIAVEAARQVVSEMTQKRYNSVRIVYEPDEVGPSGFGSRSIVWADDDTKVPPYEK